MNAPAPQSQQHPVVAFKRNLAKMIDGKELALPSNVSSDAFRNAAIVAVQDNPAILRCDTASVMKSIRTIAAAGLVPDGREAAIVPFGKEAQAMPMVFGLIKMARRSGDVSDIRAHIVYQNELDRDLFSYVVGDEETLTHKPILFGDKGAAVAAYAIAKLKDGTIVRAFMDKDEIEKVRKSSPQQKKSANPTGIWQQWTEEMWKKTVIRRLCKRLDLSAEDMRRMMVDQDQTPAIKDVTPQEEQRPNLAQRLTGAADDPKEEPQNTLEGEILPADEDQAPVEQQGQEGGSTEQTEAYLAGAAAFKDGFSSSDCPHKEDGPENTDWLRGWNDAYNAADQEGGDA